MAHFDIYRDQLAITHPSFGHALWNPAPEEEYGPVKVGDVGYVREGRFFRLFNALLPADDPSHKDTPLPEYHEPLIPNIPHHIFKGTLKPNHYCSAGVNVEPARPEHLATGPDDDVQASFSCRRRRGGAVLSLPVEAHCRDTRARGYFGKWMLKHIDRWFAFARGLGLGIDQMGKLFWSPGAIARGLGQMLPSWRDKLDKHYLGLEWSRTVVSALIGSSHPVTLKELCAIGALKGRYNLPEDQCVFIRGFRVVRVLGILPKHLKGAAEPNSTLNGDHDDDEPDKELISMPGSTNYRDPLHVLSDYIVARAPHSDMVLVHDDDLARISGFGERDEFLQPGNLMAHLQTAQPEIQQILCDRLSIDEDSSKTGTETSKAAMFTEEFYEWSQIQPQRPIVYIRQRYAHQPDEPTSQVFATTSPSKHIPSDYRSSILKHLPLKEPMGDPDPLSSSAVELPQQPSGTTVPQCGSKAEQPSRILAGTLVQEHGNILSTSLTHVLCFIAAVLRILVRLLKYPSITLAIAVCIYPLTMMSDAFRSALAPICTAPVASLLCPIIAHSPRQNPERTTQWADFPSLVNVERRTLEFLLDKTVEGLGLALEMKKVEIATGDLVTLVRISKLNSREILADPLSEFVKGAHKVGCGLTRFSSKVGGAVDAVIAINDYALHTIEGANSRPSGLPFRRLWSPHPSEATKEIVTRTFTEAMDMLTVKVQRLVLEAEMSISDLNNLEEYLTSIHEVISREDSSITTAKSESLAQLWTTLGGNRDQLNGLGGHLALLRGVSEYKDRALAHVLAASQMLETMAEDMKELRERVAAPEPVGDAIPLDVHMKSLRNGLEGLKGRRVGAKQLEEQTANRILGSVGEVKLVKV